MQQACNAPMDVVAFDACEPSLAHRGLRERGGVGDQRCGNSRGELRIIVSVIIVNVVSVSVVSVSVIVVRDLRIIVSVIIVSVGGERRCWWGLLERPATA